MHKYSLTSRGPVPEVRGFHAFRGPGPDFRVQGSGGFHAFRGPVSRLRPASRGPVSGLSGIQGTMWPGFQAFRGPGQGPQSGGFHAFRRQGPDFPPGFPVAFRGQGPVSMLSGGQGPRSLWFFSGYAPITSSFIFSCLHKYTHFQDITPRFFSFFRITIQFAA